MNDTFNDLLNQFLDETISDVNESALFSMVHADSDLRQQFVTAVRMRAASPALAQRAAIPQALTSRILAPSTVSEAASGQAPYWTPRLLAPIGAMLLSGALFLSGYVSGSNAQSGKQTVRDQAVATTQEQTPIAVSAMDQQRAETQTALGTERQSGRNAVAVSNEVEDIRSKPVHESMTTTRITNAPQLDDDAKSMYMVNTDQRPSSTTVHPSLASSAPTSQAKQFSVALRTLNPIGSNGVGIASNDNTGINNIAVDGMIRLSDGIDVGLEFGRQSFLQTYQRTVGAATEQVQQYPALWWSGPTARFTARDLLADGISPFSQAVFGISEGGVLARALAGIEWRPADIVSIQGAMECSNLWYTGGGATNTSLQFNWTLGVGILW